MEKARPRQRNKFYKTRLCPYHFKKGSVCKEGANCSYAHSFEELRASVDLTKTKLCNDFALGECLRPIEACPFAHGIADMREPVIPGDQPRPPPAAAVADDEDAVTSEAVTEALKLLRLMSLREQSPNDDGSNISNEANEVSTAADDPETLHRVLSLSSFSS